MSDELVFFSETTEALFAELGDVIEASQENRKINRKYLVGLCERLAEQIPIAAGETMAGYLQRVSDHLEGGLANTAMVAQANAGLLSPADELKALEYQKALIEERMEHLRWLRDYPEVAALFEERAE